jgi:hypothetical protein
MTVRKSVPVDCDVVGRLVDEVDDHSVSLAGMDGGAWELPVHRRDDPRRLAKLAHGKVSDLAKDQAPPLTYIYLVQLYNDHETNQMRAKLTHVCMYVCMYVVHACMHMYVCLIHEIH